MKYDYDLIIIGGGSAGLSLASISARLGVKVALIDKGTLGGDCLHFGCVPSKTLIHSAKVAHMAKTGQRFGISCPEVHTDFEAVQKNIRDVISTIQDHADNADRFRSLGCSVWTEATATFVDKHSVRIGDELISAGIIAICAGTRPAHLAVDGLESIGFQTNETIFSMHPQPKHLTVIGSGPIGCELAQAFQRLGTSVTLVNRSNRILSKEDPDVQKHMLGVFEKEGISLQLGCTMKRAFSENGQKVLVIDKDGEEIHVRSDEILVATGRTSNADTMHIENAGVKLDERGYIQTDAYLRTNVPHIWAAGDITGHLQFTHSAGYEAGIIVRNGILLPKALQRWPLMKKHDISTVPWATFTDPEVASTGMNESTAKKMNIDHTVSVFSLKHQDRALAEGQAEGFIKIIIGKKDEILGCQIVGPNAGELIHEWIIARSLKATLSSLSKLTHIYPTLSGGNQQAAGAYLSEKFFTPLVRKRVRKFLGYRNTAIDDKE